MPHAYYGLAFTPSVIALQKRFGSYNHYAASADDEFGPTISQAEASFIAAADHFYQATISETGWPYVQHRGGPAGFLKVIDERTIAYADFSGNRQYISAGNLAHGDGRVSLIIVDYVRKARLKIMGHARLIDANAAPELIEHLRMPNYPATIERAIVIRVEGFDWNCPQHITQRFTVDDWPSFDEEP